MEHKSDRRRLHRINNPDAVVRYKVKKKSGLMTSYSNVEQVLNLSKSGIAMNLSEQLNFGKDILLKLNFEDGKTLKLKGHVRWQNREDLSTYYMTGIQFQAFGRRDGYNSPKALDYLRSLQGQKITKTNYQPSEKH